jgi:hypothetical protein
MAAAGFATASGLATAGGFGFATATSAGSVSGGKAVQQSSLRIRCADQTEQAGRQQRGDRTTLHWEGSYVQERM